MKKCLAFVCCIVLFSTSLWSQDMMYVYRKSGETLKFVFNKIDSMMLVDGLQVDKVMQIHLKDSIVNLTQTEIDSIIFHPVIYTDKRGFVIFRVDDTQYYSEIAAMSKVFDKYGFKMVNIYNMNAAFSANLWKAMSNFQAMGHEIGDHTPNHTTAYTDMAIDKQVQQFVGMPGVERITGKRIYFKWTYPKLESCLVAGKTIRTKAGTSMIYGDLAGVKAPDDVIYTNEFGWVHLINKTDTSASVINIRNYWAAEKLVFAKSSTESLYKCYIYDVYLDEDATTALLLSSRVLFDYYKFKRPTFWAFTGNYLAVVRAETMKSVGPRFGYIGSICPNLQHRMVPFNYNQKDSLIRWSQTGTTFFVENNTAVKSMQHIANMVAKHQVAIDNGHFWYKDPARCPQYVGTVAEKFDQYLATLDSVLNFCYINNIAVLPYERAIPTMLDHRQDSTVNMIPPLYNDLTDQGYPDGYSLDPKVTLVKNEGVAEDRFYSLKRNSNGNLYSIFGTGGFDQGINKLSFYAKGADNSSITVTVNYYTKAGGFTDVRKTVVKITGATDSFVKFDSNLEIPASYDHIVDVRVDVGNNLNKDMSISGMFLGKVKL